jgi:ABC-type antimicrobial peptide transport system permease subunit
MVATRSLAYVFLSALLALVVGSLLYLAFDQTLGIIFERPDWTADPSAAESRSETGKHVKSGQRTLEVLWGVVPIIGIAAIGYHVIAQSRDTR